MQDTLHRLYRTKVALLATVLTFVGLAMAVTGHWLATTPGWGWLADLAIAEVGSAIFTSGLVVVAFDYAVARDARAQDQEQYRQAVRTETPLAVIEGLAAKPVNLARLSSVKTLDQVVENCLVVRLDDAELAHDLYEDLRKQVLGNQDRRRDVHVSISLARQIEPTPAAEPMFVATVRWEYRTKLTSRALRYSCVSDRDQYRSLLRDPTSAGVWYFRPTAGLTGASPESFELVQFLVNGNKLAARRTEQAASQTYTVDLGTTATDQTGMVQISCTYRVLVPQRSHLIYLDFDKPCRGVKVELWYGGAGIDHVNVLDFIGGALPTAVQLSPPSVPTPMITVGYDGWVFPRSGVAFVWALDSMSHHKTRTRSKATPSR